MEDLEDDRKESSRFMEIEMGLDRVIFGNSAATADSYVGGIDSSTEDWIFYQTLLM